MIRVRSEIIVDSRLYYGGSSEAAPMKEALIRNMVQEIVNNIQSKGWMEIGEENLLSFGWPHRDYASSPDRVKLWVEGYFTSTANVPIIRRALASLVRSNPGNRKVQELKNLLFQTETILSLAKPLEK